MNAAAAGMKAVAMRAIASPDTPHASTAFGVAIAIVDFVLFVAGAVAAIVTPWWSVKLAGVAVAGVAMLFALAHDAAHGTLAHSKGMNRLPAAIVAAGSTSVSGR